LEEGTNGVETDGERLGLHMAQQHGRGQQGDTPSTTTRPPSGKRAKERVATTDDDLVLIQVLYVRSGGERDLGHGDLLVRLGLEDSDRDRERHGRWWMSE
jgi:hypothetical protein